MNDYVSRQLIYHVDGEEIRIGDKDLLALGYNIIILGEAGMGKTELLKNLEGDGANFILARRLAKASDPRSLVGNSNCVLIDALDEVPSYKNGDAIDELVSKLEQAGSPKFILSCRAEDWREATAKSMIEAVYGNHPIEVTLSPFDENQIIAFLSSKMKLERAKEVFDHYRDRGFNDWLGNPQTLSMLANVVTNSGLPEGTADLFSHYVDLAWSEANNVRRESSTEVPKDAALDTLGAAFAAVIICGKEGFTREGAKTSDTFLNMGELARLPKFDGWPAIEGNRLLAKAPQSAGGFTYVHRRVGEWLAARWLARQATNSKIRDRLLDNLIVDGVVPASLRGLFAWLAIYDGFGERIIATDPMAVIEYGDADGLGEHNSQVLLDALGKLAESNPWFAGGGDFRARALVNGAMRGQTLEKILDTQCPARLRLLLSRQFRGVQLRKPEIRAFRKLVLEPSDFYALREEAAHTLVSNLSTAEWRKLASDVMSIGRKEDARLAAFIVMVAGIERFDDDQVAEIVMAAGGFGPNGPFEDDSHVGMLWRFRYDVPDERLGGLLDAFADRAQERLPEYRSIESSDIVNLGDCLIARRLERGAVDPSRLLKWLRAFGGKDSYSDDAEKRIAKFIQDNDELRRAMQREWLSDTNTPENFRQAVFRMEEIHPALMLSDSDFADLLSRFPSDYPHWKDIAWVVNQTKEEGQQTREQLRRFAKDEDQFESWVEQILNPTKPDWQVEQEERNTIRKSEREKRWTKFRKGLAKEKGKLVQGKYGVLLQCANVYFSRYSDLAHLQSVQERLDALIGPDLIIAFQQGLDAWLKILPQWPHAEIIARDYSNNRAWSSRHILLAALSERIARNGTLGSLDDDQLLAAQLHIANYAASGDEWKDLRNAIWTRIVSDPRLFERYARLACEGSLSKRSEIVSGLYEIMHDAALHQPEIVSRLALEWLKKHWRMHWRAEKELLDFLLAKKQYDALRPLVAIRLDMKTLTDERRRNWLAVGLIVDFEKYETETASALAKDPELFWAIRERIGARRPFHDLPIDVPIELAGWLVKHARKLFPVVDRPSTVTTGDTNPWDATEAIGRMISAIGTESSNRAGQVLQELAEINDGYRDRVLSVFAEYRQKRAETSRATINLTALTQILSDGSPQTMPDLRSEVLRLLEKVQAIITSNPTDSWRNFYKDDKQTPKEEEDCSDALVDILNQCGSEVRFNREKHLGDDREGDIACEIGNLHLPIEVKGQWHRELWRAADHQLAAQQAIDHSAEGYGILLALWFGPKSGAKRLVGPPKKSGLNRPKSAEGLEVGLAKVSKSAADGRIKIKVLDLSRG